MSKKFIPRQQSAGSLKEIFSKWEDGNIPEKRETMVAIQQTVEQNQVAKDSFLKDN